MFYSATWSNANAQGRLDPGGHFIAQTDPQELAQAVNRRRLLVFQSEQDFPFDPFVEISPTTDFRQQITGAILQPSTGVLGGDPPTPEGMVWLWPVADGDENKIITPSSPGENQVCLFEKLNGGENWTDAALAERMGVRAVHANELRQAVEWIRRGRWTLPIYFAAGISSVLPDTPWIGEVIANNGTYEVRSVGLALFRYGSAPTLGLQNVAARASSKLEITADRDCTVQVYRCKRPIDFAGAPPTWNQYDPSQGLYWDSPGGLGGADVAYIGTLNLTADEPDELTGSAVQAAFQAILDDAEQNFLLRRSDTDNFTVAVSGRVIVEFDLDSPPN